MEKQIIIIIIISVIFHTVLNLRKKIFSKKIFYLLGTSILLGLMVNKDNPEFSVNKILLAIPFCFVVGLGGIFKNEILHPINERILHIISLIYLYSIILNVSITDNFLIVGFLSTPVIIVIFYSVSTHKLKNIEKIFLYCLNIIFLCVVDFFNLKRIVKYELPVNKPDSLDIDFILSIFFVSGILFYLIIYLMNLLYAIPLRGKEESEENMKIRIEEQKALFESKMSEEQASPVYTLIFTVVIFIFININQSYNYIPHSYFTEIFLNLIIIWYTNREFLKKIFFRLFSYVGLMK